MGPVAPVQEEQLSDSTGSAGGFGTPAPSVDARIEQVLAMLEQQQSTLAEQKSMQAQFQQTLEQQQAVLQ